MITVEQALDKILDYANVLEEEAKPILDCVGQVLASDIYSAIDVPPLDNSAMDGYAVQAGNTAGASSANPKVMKVIGEIAAGSMAGLEVTSGTAIRIMTGAVVPRGADSVVQFEDTDEIGREASSSEIGIKRQVPVGLNIRRAGEDIKKGDLALKKGTALRPQEIGVLASLGISQVPVIRRPTVAVLATGDELVDIQQSLSPGKIYNSNSYSIAAQVQRYGGIPKVLGIAPDHVGPLTEKIRQGLDSDMLITSGGVSVGDYDIVKDVLAKEGEIGFWTVRMKPGKPIAFGILQGKTGRKVIHLGLPGNPVSSMITFELFARPAIMKMMGKKNLAKPTIPAIMESNISNNDGRRVFARVVVRKREDRYFACLVERPQGSGILTSMTQANGLAIVPEDRAEIRQGDIVQVMMLDWNEEQG